MFLFKPPSVEPKLASETGFYLNMMVEDASSGKQPVDDERQINRVELWLDRVIVLIVLL